MRWLVRHANFLLNTYIPYPQHRWTHKLLQTKEQATRLSTLHLCRQSAMHCTDTQDNAELASAHVPTLMLLLVSLNFALLVIHLAEVALEVPVACVVR